MRLAILCVLFFAAIGAIAVLVQFPFSQLKKEYAWVDRALVERSDTVLKDKSGDSTFCYIGPQAFPVSTARAQFPTYWIEPFASDGLADTTGTWTLAIASKAKNIVALRASGTERDQKFPEDVSCGATLTLTPTGKEWTVLADKS
ncbi:hypothetical protein [Microvirga puerhi]|uniref:DUF1254 domain-containing protein n=1 Tax=Microvirga puerhi TaxID=2876078 RepID=A0ABS7VRB6_9HYPH|nr:hypothetical protein [Microvirga puerhi]MBZ6078092.1 hypothetical protein [Microvirga puerhi]